jgi:hypothetical protein
MMPQAHCRDATGRGFPADAGAGTLPRMLLAR